MQLERELVYLYHLIESITLVFLQFLQLVYELPALFLFLSFFFLSFPHYIPTQCMIPCVYSACEILNVDDIASV